MRKILPIEGEDNLYNWVMHYHPIRQKFFMINRDYYTEYWSNLDEGLEKGLVIDITLGLGQTIASRITREIAIQELAKNKKKDDTRTESES